MQGVDAHLFRPIPESYWVIPGRLLAGEYPGKPFSPEITRARLDAFLQAGFDTFINLTCEDEIEDYAAMLGEQAGYFTAKVECLRFPIDDFGLPTQQKMTDILAAIDLALQGDHRIYLHCYGGIGRTGTTVGCYLASNGCPGDQALEKLAGWWRSVPKSRVHPRSPETAEQEQFVREWLQGQNSRIDI
jgi:hypothetical protein